jgi:hypothetical protein
MVPLLYLLLNRNFSIKVVGTVVNHNALPVIEGWNQGVDGVASKYVGNI